MIIDIHTHVDHAEVYGWIDPPEKLLALMDEAAIEKAAIMTYLDHPVGLTRPTATVRCVKPFAAWMSWGAPACSSTLGKAHTRSAWCAP